MLLQMALFHSFYGQIVFHCICLSIPRQWTFRLLLHLSYVTSAAMNIGVHVSFWSVVFSNTCPAVFLSCSSAPDTKRDQLGETYLDGNSETWKSP